MVIIITTQRRRKTREGFFNKIYVPLTLFVRVRKGYSRFACERELETEQKLQYFDPTLMAANVVSFSFSWCSTGGPGVHSAGWWLSLLHLISNFSGPQNPSIGCGFPYHLSSITPSPTVTGTRTLTSVLTDLYNSFKSHVWSSSSGNNCHAVHRSLSYGASVYECTMGIFYLVPFHEPISAHTISSHNCH